MLSHKQRNNWCTAVSAHLGEQIDVEISNNNSFHLMHALARRWMMRARCKRSSDDSISKYNPNIIHRKPLTYSVTCSDL